MRYARYLRQRYAAILSYVGESLLIVSFVFWAPMLTALAYPSEVRHLVAFAGPAAGLMALGLLLWRIPHSRAVQQTLTIPEATVSVVVIWIVVMLVGALPYILAAGMLPLHALFESVSGYSTTGLTLLPLDAAPRMVLIYRSLTQLAGGTGFAILVLSSIIAGPAGAGLASAEGRTGQYAPNVRESANIVLRIYATYAVLGVLALRVAGMDWFDALAHAFAGVSTGGFSTRAGSIGHWNSPAIEAVTMVMMFVSAFNYLTAYALLRGKVREVLRNGELQLLLIVLPLALAVLLWGVGLRLFAGASGALRYSLFQVVTALTTTGYAVGEPHGWPEIGWLLIVGLMCIGGGVESTSGGLKQFRVFVLLKMALWEIRQAFRPRGMVNEPEVWRGDQKEYLSDVRVRQIALYVFIYVVVGFVGSLAVAAHGHNLRDSVFEFASALGTVGLSSGVTSPQAPPSLLAVLMVGMFLGRLEILTVVVGLAKLATDSFSMLPLPGRR